MIFLVCGVRCAAAMAPTIWCPAGRRRMGYQLPVSNSPAGYHHGQQGIIPRYVENLGLPQLVPDVSQAQAAWTSTKKLG